MVLGANLKEVGVRAVVAGISEFTRNIAAMNRGIDGFGAKASAATKRINPLGAAIEGLSRFLRDVAAVATGIVVAGVFRKIGEALANVAKEAIAAGERFQILEIRLQGLIARDLAATDAASNFKDALAQSIPIAESLFFWIQKIALQSPLDIEQVANVFTLAKAYGFANDASKELTQSIVDFTSGMGLGNLEAVRVIENLGQMVSQGKIAGTELRDLGRGAFVPVNRLLSEMQERLGLTDDEFDDFKKTGEGVNEFIKQFVSFVGTDFPGAGERASRTLQAVRGNFMDLLQGVLGFNVVKPILDGIADRAATLLDAFTEGDRGERLIEITRQIGEALSGIVGLFLEQGPDVDTFADTVINALDRIKGFLFGLQEILRSVFAGDVSPGQGFAAFLDMIGVPQSVIDTFWNLVDAIDTAKIKLGEIRDRALNAFDVFKEEGLLAGLGALGVPQPVIEFIDKIIQGFKDLTTFWDENKEQIRAIFDTVVGAILGIGESGAQTVLEVLGTQFARFAEKIKTEGPRLLDVLERFADILEENVVPWVEAFGGWVIANQNTIVNFVLGFWAGLKLLSAILTITAAGLAALVGAFIAVSSPIIALLALIPVLTAVIFAFGHEAWVAAGQLGTILIIALVSLANAIATFFQTGRDIGISIIGGIISGFERFKEAFIGVVFNIGTRLLAVLHDWWNIGRATGNSIIGGIISGFLSRAGEFISLVITLALNAWNTVKAILGIGSPSKLFMGIGEDIVGGMIQGLKNMDAALQNAIGTTVGLAIAPVVNTGIAAAPSPVTNITNNNFGLTVNSASQAEPVIADFQMMQALMGGP